MKPKDATKLEDVPHIQKKSCYLNMGYSDIYIGLVNNMEIKKDGLHTLSGVKMHID